MDPRVPAVVLHYREPSGSLQQEQALILSLVQRSLSSVTTVMGAMKNVERLRVPVSPEDLIADDSRAHGVQSGLSKVGK